MSRKKSKSNVAESEELIDNSPQIVESVSDDARLYEIARLRDLWRVNGLFQVRGIFDLILKHFPDPIAKSDVNTPFTQDGLDWDLKSILATLKRECVGQEALRLDPFAQAVRRQARKVGISIYVLVALHQMGEEV